MRSMRSILCGRKKLGVDVDALLVSQPDTGEQALEIAKCSSVQTRSTLL